MKAFTGKSRSSMTQRRMDLLEKIKFEWAKPKGVAAWDEKFEELKEYKEKYGDCEYKLAYICAQDPFSILTNAY